MKTYRSPQPLARAASLAIGVAVLLILFEITWTVASSLMVVDLLPSVDQGWTTIEKIEQANIVLYLIALCFAAVTFIRWQQLLIRNLFILEEPAPDPSWAALGWFIPFANLLVPYQTFHKIAGSLVDGGRNARPLVNAWWLSWLLAAFGGGVANFFFLTTEMMDRWLLAAAIDFTASGFRLIGGLLAILLLHRLSQLQDSMVRSRTKALAREASPA